MELSKNNIDRISLDLRIEALLNFCQTFSAKGFNAFPAGAVLKFFDIEPEVAQQFEGETVSIDFLTILISNCCPEKMKVPENTLIH